MTNDAWSIHASGLSDHKEAGNAKNAVMVAATAFFAEEICKSLSLFRDSAGRTTVPPVDLVTGMNEESFDNPSINYKHKSEVQFSQTSKGSPSANQPESKGLFGRNRRNNG